MLMGRCFFSFVLGDKTNMKGVKESAAKSIRRREEEGVRRMAYLEKVIRRIWRIHELRLYTSILSAKLSK